MAISDIFKKAAKKLDEPMPDPVCGMLVDPVTAIHKSIYQGKNYYHCSPHCKEEFDRSPEKYAH